MKRNIIIFDTETNGLDKCSVLSIAAIKIEIDTETLEVVERETFERYYYRNPGEIECEEAIKVNGLTVDRIKELRGISTYPLYFKRDVDFIKFCEDTEHYVAHNIEFDRKFLDIQLKNQFCTKLENIDILKIPGSYGKYKWPRLNETAIHYGIELENELLHGSLYDAEICKKIFLKMLIHDETKNRVLKFLNN